MERRYKEAEEAEKNKGYSEFEEESPSVLETAWEKK